MTITAAPSILHVSRTVGHSAWRLIWWDGKSNTCVGADGACSEKTYSTILDAASDGLRRFGEWPRLDKGGASVFIYATTRSVYDLTVSALVDSREACEDMEAAEALSRTIPSVKDRPLGHIDAAIVCLQSALDKLKLAQHAPFKNEDQ